MSITQNSYFFYLSETQQETILGGHYDNSSDLHEVSDSGVLAKKDKAKQKARTYIENAQVLKDSLLQLAEALTDN
jgi:hypothetical protein